MLLPPAGDDWVALSAEPLPLGTIAPWPMLANCGACVMFAGTVRDHADGRPGVVSLEYEAYEKAALREMESIVAKLRHSWPRTGRIALLHRTGLLVPSDVCVIVAVSAPHRAEAFEAARYGIDATKELVPIWKRESWQGGSSWGLDSTPARGAGDLNAEDHLSRAGN